MKLTSALIFDIGVYLVVVGLALMVFEAFGDDRPAPRRRSSDVSVAPRGHRRRAVRVGTYLLLQRKLRGSSSASA